MDWILDPGELAGARIGDDLEPLWLGSEAPAASPLVADRELAAALRVLAAPEVRVTIDGNHPDAIHSVRMRGCTAGHRSVLAVQDSKARGGYRGTVRLWSGPDAALAEHISYAMPAVHRGQRPRADDAATTRALLDAPRIGGGRVTIDSTPIAATPGPSATLDWLDIACDGRYLAHTGARTTIIPASASTVAAVLDRIIAGDRLDDPALDMSLIESDAA
ncbi:hypothetical protein ABZ319_22685 [Nocardia sp. NPDC005978]|uniref:hypothetical protein n=1 Tax=Nocardia sp. NPDC005978 TaxID=3156725 RepID=UPI0033BC002A